MIFAAVLMPCLHDLGHLEHPCSHRRVYVRWQHRNYSGVQAEGWRSPGWRLSRARMSFGMVVWLSLVSIDVDILPLTHNKVRLPQATAEGEPPPYSEDTWSSHSSPPFDLGRRIVRVWSNAVAEYKTLPAAQRCLVLHTFMYSKMFWVASSCVRY